MPVAPQDRPIAALREETIDQLIMNYGHGKLSEEALERRIDQALDARSHEELAALTADLDLIADKAYKEKKQAELGAQIDLDSPQAKDVDRMIHIFGGSNRTGSWSVAKHIWMLNLFGGCDLDFTHARFSARETHIKMFCLFGGANFYVSENINTVSNVQCIFGGIDNGAPSTNDPGAPKLIIEGLVFFGGASIKVKRTWREHWIDFADRFRRVFTPPSNTR